MHLDTLTDYDKNRINSWLQEAKNISKRDYFKKMIFYWISFNCFYGAKNIKPKGRKFQYEKTKIKNVLSHLPLIGENWSKKFLRENNDIIEEMKDFMKHEYYKNQFSKYKKELAKENFRNAFIELILSINLVRNRLFHGGKSYDKPEYGNKEVLTTCSKILDRVMTELKENEWGH